MTLPDKMNTLLPIQLDYLTRNEIRHALAQRVAHCENEVLFGRAAEYYTGQARLAREALAAFETAVNTAMEERTHATDDKGSAR